MGPYPIHWTVQQCLQMYATKDPTILRGKMRVLPGKDSSAFVTCDRGRQKRDVLIATPLERNRALDGDQVYVELLPLNNDDDNDDNDTKKPNETEAEITELAQNLDRVDMTNQKRPMTWQDDKVQSLLWDPLVPVRQAPPQGQEESQSSKPDAGQQKGRVVCVVPPKTTQLSELNPSDSTHGPPKRTIVGTIKVMPKRDGQKVHLLTPNNRCLPQFLCPSRFRPHDDDDDEGGLYKAEYVYGSWAPSHHWPPCIRVQPMGQSCSVLQDETLALLEENGVNHGDFPPNVLRNVDEAVQSGLHHKAFANDDLGWRPTPDMYRGRRDYRQQRIFTIDPTTARDLDDALHVTELPDGRVEIGVHIADVSYFVRPDTAVDAEATRRATTVYLVDRVIPMLPRPLCEVACSLNENVERLAFSCVWRMNQDGTLQTNNKKKKGDEVWYGKSVIKSCARLDYATAQNIIDQKVANGESLVEMDKTLWPPHRRPTGGHTVDQVANDVRLMHRVAMARRLLRFRNGAVALNGIKLTFQLESDGETPALCAPYPIRDSNRLVEEYMLLANYLVAQRLLTHAGPLALLRHHPPPVMDGIQSVVDMARAAHGFHIDAKSSKSLQQSLSRLGRECRDELVIQCITEMLMTPMKPAEYLAAGEVEEVGWRHFALNIPYYTHFTSPIRRYADVIVHRLLQATLDNDNNTSVCEFGMKQDEIQSVCDHCNDKKMASKTAQDRSDRVFLAIYLKRKPLRSTLGVVLSVGEKTFTVFVPDLGVSAKVFCDEQKDLVKAEPYTVHNHQRRIKLIRKGGGSSAWREIDVKVFTKLKVAVLCKEKPPMDIAVKLEGPWTES